MTQAFNLKYYTICNPCPTSVFKDLAIHLKTFSREGIMDFTEIDKKIKNINEYAKSLDVNICNISCEWEENGERRFLVKSCLNEPSEKFKESCDSNIHLTKERKAEFYDIMDKHTTDFLLDCKAHGISPGVVSGINFTHVHEIDYLNQLDELRLEHKIQGL